MCNFIVIIHSGFHFEQFATRFEDGGSIILESKAMTVFGVHIIDVQEMRRGGLTDLGGC